MPERPGNGWLIIGKEDELEEFLKVRANKKLNLRPHDCLLCIEDSLTYSQGVHDGMVMACKALLEKFFTEPATSGDNITE